MGRLDKNGQYIEQLEDIGCPGELHTIGELRCAGCGQLVGLFEECKVCVELDRNIFERTAPRF